MPDFSKIKTAPPHLAMKVTRWIGSTQSITAHTIFFIVCFVSVYANLLSFDRMLLVLTTLVSLEAIYLAIFIQMTINRTTQSIAEVEEDIDEIQKDVDELQEDVEEMSEEDKAEARRDAVHDESLLEIRKKLVQLGKDLETLAHRPTVTHVPVEQKIEEALPKVKKASSKKKSKKK